MITPSILAHCPACHAVVNRIWLTCAVCSAPLSPPSISPEPSPTPLVPAAVQPTPPIQPGWVISWRDQFGRLIGGWDEPELGTVAECTWTGSTWRVQLTTGNEVALRRIVGVRKMRAGECIAAWTTREHGLDGEGGRGQ